MSQEFKMNARLAQDVIQSQTLKKPDFGDVPWEDLMTHIRASLGMTGFSYLDPSRETELIAKINELETARDKKADEYKEILGIITKEIESLKSDKK